MSRFLVYVGKSQHTQSFWNNSTPVLGIYNPVEILQRVHHKEDGPDSPHCIVYVNSADEVSRHVGVQCQLYL